MARNPRWMRGSRDGKPGKNGGGRRNHVTVKMLWWIILPLVEKWAELSRVFGPFDLGFKNTAFKRVICTCIVLCNFCGFVNKSKRTHHSFYELYETSHIVDLMKVRWSNEAMKKESIGLERHHETGV